VIAGEILLGFATFQWLAELLRFDNQFIVLIAFLLSPATILYEHFQAILQGLHRFSQSVIMNVIQAVMKATATVLFWFGEVTTATPLLIMYLSAPLLPVLFVKKLLPRWFSLNIFTKDFSTERSLTKSIISHAAVSYMAAGIIENIDILFVQRFLNTYEAGLFGGVSRIALLFALMAYSLGTVLNPRVAAYTTTRQLTSFVKKSLLLVAACVIGFLVYLIVAKWLLIFTIGSEYLSGLSVMNILVASSFLTLAVMPFVALFFSFDAPWFFSVSGLLQLGIIIVGNVVFVPVYGLEASAWTRLISRAVFFVFTVAMAYYMYRKHVLKDSTQLSRVEVT